MRDYRNKYCFWLLGCANEMHGGNLSQAPSRSTPLIAKTVLLLRTHTQLETPSELMNAILGFLRKAGQKSPPPLPPLRQAMGELQIVAKDIISRAPEIIAATQGASADSIFHNHQLPPLNKEARRGFPPFAVRIEGLDRIHDRWEVSPAGSHGMREIAVLNLASNQYRTGGWRDTFCKIQVRKIPTPVSLRLNSPLPGRGTILLFRSVHQPRGGKLPLAEPRIRFRHLLLS